MGVAIALVAALVLGVVAVGVVGALAAPTDRTAEPGYDGYRPNRSTGGPATAQATPTTDAQATTEPRATSAAPRSSAAPRTTAARPAPRPVEKLADHPINREVGLAPAACALPRFSADAAGQERYYRAALPCLDQAWRPILDGANLPFSSPGLQMATTGTTTPCGSSTDTGILRAFYCGDNATIYMPVEESSRFGDDPAWYLRTLMHEYGHHVQSLSGLLGASWTLRYEVGVTSPEGQLASRRAELQATCFEGMALASLTAGGGLDRGLVDRIVAFEHDMGDEYRAPGAPRTHGNTRSNGAWADQGRTLNLVFQCNTWNLGAETVE